MVSVQTLVLNEGNVAILLLFSEFVMHNERYVLLSSVTSQEPVK